MWYTPPWRTMPRAIKRARSVTPTSPPTSVRRWETSDFWAFLTFLAFPIGSGIAHGFDLTPISAFGVGMGSSLTIILANVLAEGRLWMFAPKWQARFQHPEFSFRLALVTGALLLIVETLLFVLFFTEGSLDEQLIRLVFARQCQAPSPAFLEFCDALSRKYLLFP